MRIVQFFRDVECDLKVIQSIANVISDTLIPLLGKEPRKTYLHLLYQTKKVDEIIRQVIEYGPMLEYEMTRKIAEDKEGD